MQSDFWRLFFDGACAIEFLISMKHVYIISYVAINDQLSLVAALRPYKFASFLLQKEAPVTIIVPRVGDGTEHVVTEGFFISRFKFFLKIFPPDFTFFWSIGIFLNMRNKWKQAPFSLFTTCPPYGLGFLGLLLKWAGYKFTWICDFRDLWLGNPLYRPPFTKRFFNPWFEKMFYQKCDIMTFNTLWDMEYNCARYPFLRAKSIFVRNGFDTVTPNTCRDDFRFVYAGGTTKGEASPRVINLLEILNAHGIPATCDFYGEFDQFLNKNSYTRYCGVVASEKIPELLSKYKFGFIYLPGGCETGGRVAQKFYDYMGAGVIPVVINPSLEMVMMMKELKTGVTMFNNTSTESLIDQIKGATFAARPEELEKLRRTFQFEKLYSVMMN